MDSNSNIQTLPQDVKYAREQAMLG